MALNNHIQRWLVIAATTLCTLALSAQTLSEEATLSLLTCSPGDVLYYRYGHSAIRVQDPALTAPDGNTYNVDLTFNYGCFDFNQKDFYIKFVKGETDYQLGLEYTSDFLISSIAAGRTIYYQPLRLTQEEKQTIWDALIYNAMPENCFYRYNFVFDNCATRPWVIIRDKVGLPHAEGMAGRTWRENLDFFSGKWTWSKFGINICFGYEADEEMTLEQSLFLPENLMNYISKEGLSEDEYIAPFEPRNGSFWTSPELAILLLFLLIIGCTALDIYRKKQCTWPLDTALFAVYFVLGTVITLLFFFSQHPFVGSNLNVLYLNPLWIVALVLSCFKKGRKWLRNISPVWLVWLVIAMMWMLLKHQTLHLMLTLVFLHTCRFAMLRKLKISNE